MIALWFVTIMKYYSTSSGIIFLNLLSISNQSSDNLLISLETSYKLSLFNIFIKESETAKRHYKYNKN